MRSSAENAEVGLGRDVVERRVIEIVSDFAKRVDVEIGPDTGLVFDLGISGDDGDLLFVKITKVFPIDMTGSDLGSRFGKDGWWPWEIPVAVWRGIGGVARRWMFKSTPHDRREQDVYVRDIVDAVLDGKWMSQSK
jgi:hypothetical protein